MQDKQQCCITFSMGKLFVVMCVCVCVYESRMNFVYEIDVGQGLGLCTQRLNDRTLEGWHISQAEQTNTHLYTHTHTHTYCKAAVYYTTSTLTFP